MQEQQMAEDLRFFRSMVESTQRRFDPGAPIMITWGLICLFGYPASSWLAVTGRESWINGMWMILALGVGLPLSGWFGYRLGKRALAKGVNLVISRQIGWVWVILVSNGLLWSALLPRFLPGEGPAFLWAALYGIGLSMMGILYSKEWLLAGFLVFAAIVAAAFFHSAMGVILGAAMGLGCIVPAVIALRRKRRWEAEDAHA